MASVRPVGTARRPRGGVCSVRVRLRAVRRGRRPPRTGKRGMRTGVSVPTAMTIVVRCTVHHGRCVVAVVRIVILLVWWGVRI